MTANLYFPLDRIIVAVSHGFSAQTSSVSSVIVFICCKSALYQEDIAEEVAGPKTALLAFPDKRSFLLFNDYAYSQSSEFSLRTIERIFARVDENSRKPTRK